MPSALGAAMPQNPIGRSAGTLLVGWELGAGRGHVERLVPIVRAYSIMAGMLLPRFATCPWAMNASPACVTDLGHLALKSFRRRDS